MSKSVKLVVESLVKLKDRDALEEMREHRERVRKNMLKIDGSVFTDSDIAEIDAGLLRLQTSEGVAQAKFRPK
jgi:hypothetical protein